MTDKAVAVEWSTAAKDADQATEKLERVRPQGNAFRILNMATILGLSYMGISRLLGMKKRNFEKFVFDPNRDAPPKLTNEVEDIFRECNIIGDEFFELKKQGSLTELTIYLNQAEFLKANEPLAETHTITSHDMWNAAVRMAYSKSILNDDQFTLKCSQPI